MHDLQNEKHLEFARAIKKETPIKIISQFNIFSISNKKTRTNDKSGKCYPKSQIYLQARWLI